MSWGRFWEIFIQMTCWEGFSHASVSANKVPAISLPRHKSGNWLSRAWFNCCTSLIHCFLTTSATELIFDQIDKTKQTARLIGNAGAAQIQAIEGDESIHLIETDEIT